MFERRMTGVLFCSLAVALSATVGWAVPQVSPPPGGAGASLVGGGGSNRDTGDADNISLIGRWAEGPCNACDGVGSIGYIGNGAYLDVVDFSTPGSEVRLGRVLVPGPINDIKVVGNYAYVANYEDGLRIIDVSNASAPVEVGSCDTPGDAQGVDVAAGLAYVADSYVGGLRIIDVTTPAAPVEIGFLDTSGDTRNVFVQGNYAYVADDYEGLRIIDVSNPAIPVEVGSFVPTEEVYDVVVSGDYAYLAAEYDGVRALDVSDPTAPVEVDLYDPSGRVAVGVTLAGDYLYAGMSIHGLRVFDISTPSVLNLVGYYTASNPTFFAWDVTVSGSRVYVADDSHAARVIDVSVPATPAEVGYYGVSDVTYGIDVDGSYAYIANMWDGLNVVDISDLSAPYHVGSLDTNTAYDCHYRDGHVFLADGYHGLRIIDVSSPTSPVEVGYIDLPARSVEVYVSGDYAYLGGYSNTDPNLSIVDISSLTAPVLDSTYDVPGTDVKDVMVVGDHAYLAAYGAGLIILDVSDPAVPVEIGSVDPGPAHGIEVLGDYAYIAAGGNKMAVVDVSDPTNPVEVGSGGIPGVALDVGVIGNLVYVASHDAGVLVFDVTDPTDPEKVATLDTGDRAQRVTMHSGRAFVGDHQDGVWILGPTILHSAVNPATGSTYHLLSRSSWTTAEAMAVSLGGHLATINDQAEQDWVAATLGEFPSGVHNDLLIGFNDTAVEGQFEWTSGDPVTYTNWASGEPNDAGSGEDYTGMYKVFGYQWNDYGGADYHTRRGVVEIPGPAVMHTVLNPANGHTYHLLEHSTWLAAEATAVLLGGHLVTINDQAESDWLIATFGEYPTGTSNTLLLGFNDIDVEGQFEWTSGEPVTYTNWYPGEPNDSGSGEDYTLMKEPVYGWQWNDYSGYDWSSYHGVVEVVTEPGVGYCFGDPGSGTPCPCDNDNDGSVPGSGCDNGSFASGAKLIGGGIASITADSLILSTSNLEPSNSGLYFQADNDLSPGIVWGDGLRCAEGSLKRLGVRFASAGGYSDTSGLPLQISVKTGNVEAGDTKYYQCWYRTQAYPPCGLGVNDFNSSNGYAVTWIP